MFTKVVPVRTTGSVPFVLVLPILPALPVLPALPAGLI
jgi:hypothetical protein